MQLLPELEVGGVERGTVEIARALVADGHRALVVSGGGRLVAGIDACGAEHHELSIGAKRVLTFALVRRLRRLIRENDVDIVHARSRLPAWIGRLAVRGIHPQERPHWVTTVHGPYTVNAYSAVMVSGARVIAISDFIRDYIEINYPAIDPRRIRVIPRGVDTDAYPHGFTPAPAWLDEWHTTNAALGGKRLLTLPGRLTRWKGQLNFIQLIARLRARELPVHGLLVGGAHRRKPQFARELRDAAAAAGVTDAVSFLGSRADLREILAISDLAFSLTNEPEAFGRTTIEALSLGTPVVGFDHGGTGEILRTVYPSGLVANGDVAAAAERAADLLAAAPPVPRLHPYTVARMQRATLALYAELGTRRR